MILKSLLAAGCLLALTLSGVAEIHWDSPILHFNKTPNDRAAEAHYTFQNTGKTPVTFTSVKTSCGCTTARMEKKTYGPGEHGEIVATYIFHGQSGELRKLITVVTDDQPEPTTLDLRVTVHEPLEVQPALVYWKVGEPAEAKTVDIRAGSYPVKVKGVTSPNGRIAATLQTLKAGDHYIVSVKPTDTTQKEAAEIIVQTDFPVEAPMTYTIHARVK